MKSQTTLLVCLVLACSSAWADKWTLKREVKDTKFHFGDTRIVLHYDTTQNDRYPELATRVYLKDKLVANHDDVGFEKVYASPDNLFFLGLSNRGLINPAYVVFDRNGKLHKLQPHDPRKVHYFEFSVTLDRTWCDVDDPKPVFCVADGKLQDLRVRAFDGSRISLLIPEDLHLRVFLLQDLLKSHAKPKENCYVSFGTEPGGKKDELRPWDPPKRFLKLFRQSYQLKPASAYPTPDARKPFPPNNPETGIPDGIYTVEILAWLDEDTARVRTGMSRDGFRETRGESFLVERRDRMWRRVNELEKRSRRTVWK